MHNTQRIYMGGQNGAPVDHHAKGRLLINDKEMLKKEMESKRIFTGQIKGLIHNTNFSVGTNEPDFESKELGRATVENPEYEFVVLSPKPHKNITTLTLKYNEDSTFANNEPHSRTMDINKMEPQTLALTQRPKIFTHLKQTSIKFT